MEYCPTSLAQENTKFDEKRLSKLIRELANGLEQLHMSNIVQMNIKPRMFSLY